VLKDYTQINWDDPKEKVSQFFTVHEMLWLPSWQVYHKPSDIEKANLCKLADKMDKVRDYLNYAINVNCCIRPLYVNCDNPAYKGRNYNALVGGAPHSAHTTGEAMDFHVSSMVANEARHILLDKLEDFGLRMENLDNANWVHNDIREPLPGGKRFFKP
jgi:hypothetical protein